MTWMAQMMTMVPSVAVTVQSPSKVQTRQSETDSFDKLIQRKQQESAPKQETDTKEPVEAKDTQEPVQKTDEEMPDEQKSLAMTLIAEIRPEIHYEVEAAPEMETVSEPVFAPMTAEAPVVETKQEAPVMENTIVVETNEAPVETSFKEAVQTVVEETVTAPVERETVRPEQKVVTTQEARPAEQRRNDGDSDEEIVEVPVELEKPVFGEVKATPVKVAQPTREPVELEKPDAAIQIGDRVTAAIDLSRNKVEITLSPESLGKLTVEITRSENGTLSILLNATNPKAAALLEKHAGGLQELLAAGTKSDVKVEVQQSDETPRQFMDPNGHEDARQNGQQRREGQEHKQENGNDFLQKLRLGLVGLTGLAS